MSRDRYVAIWLRMLAEKEVKLKRQSYKILNDQAKGSSKAWAKHGQAAAEAVIDDSYTLLVRMLVANYSVTIRDFAALQRELTMGTKASFQDLVQGFIARQALQKATYINDTTKDRLKNEILTGQQNGLGVEAIATNIVNALGGDIAQGRAATIARTETHMAASYATHEQAKDSPNIAQKTWVAVEDDRTRQTHSDADGQTVGINDTFQVGDDDLMYPGDSSGSPEEIINCRCAVIYENNSANFEEV